MTLPWVCIGMCEGANLRQSSKSYLSIRVLRREEEKASSKNAGELLKTEKEKPMEKSDPGSLPMPQFRRTSPSLLSEKGKRIEDPWAVATN